jgi:hypothetical protein
MENIVLNGQSSALVFCHLWYVICGAKAVSSFLAPPIDLTGGRLCFCSVAHCVMRCMGSNHASAELNHNMTSGSATHKVNTIEWSENLQDTCNRFPNQKCPCSFNTCVLSICKVTRKASGYYSNWQYSWVHNVQHQCIIGFSNIAASTVTSNPVLMNLTII